MGFAVTSVSANCGMTLINVAEVTRLHVVRFCIADGSMLMICGEKKC